MCVSISESFSIEIPGCEASHDDVCKCAADRRWAASSSSIMISCIEKLNWHQTSQQHIHSVFQVCVCSKHLSSALVRYQPRLRYISRCMHPQKWRLHSEGLAPLNPAISRLLTEVFLRDMYGELSGLASVQCSGTNRQLVRIKQLKIQHSVTYIQCT